MPKIRLTVFKSFNTVILLAVTALFIFPFVWMATTAVKSYQETIVFPPKWIPEQWMWENFVTAWNSGPFLTYLSNSVVVSFSILMLQFLTIIPAAYAFAKYKFTASKLLFGITMTSLMIPPQITFVSVYLQMSNWGFMNTLIPLILPYATSAFGIFLLRQAFLQVAEEIIEAARLDDAPEWKIMWKIMVPIAKPMLITFALFSFIAHWNDYFWPLVMTNSEHVRTLPIGIAQLQNAEGGNAWHVIMAGNLILVFPILIIFFFAQRHIVKAFVYSGIK
jgi:sn-glycerol 3-phosphate transport system permease protein